MNYETELKLRLTLFVRYFKSKKDQKHLIKSKGIGPKAKYSDKKQNGPK